MSKIVVMGGTGYAGAAIVREAAKRGHTVVSFSRSLPAEKVEGVQYVQGSALYANDLLSAIEGADVIVGTLSPRGETAGKVDAAYSTLADAAAASGARLIIVGGFSSLRPAPGAPRFVEGEIPKAYAAEVKEMFNFYDKLSKTAPAELDWLYVSPAGSFGSFNPGQALGKYRVGGEIAVFDENGNSAISGADFALAVVDEIEKPAHHRTNINFAY